MIHKLILDKARLAVVKWPRLPHKVVQVPIKTLKGQILSLIQALN